MKQALTSYFHHLPFTSSSTGDQRRTEEPAPPSVYHTAVNRSTDSFADSSARFSMNVVRICFAFGPCEQQLEWSHPSFQIICTGSENLHEKTRAFDASSQTVSEVLHTLHKPHDAVRICVGFR